VSDRARLLTLGSVLAGLLALFILGIVFSPDRIQARSSGQPLLPGITAQQVDGIDIAVMGAPRVRLRRTATGWEAPSDARPLPAKPFPASADRIALFLRNVTDLRRSSLVASDARHLAELGLSAETARLLVLYRAGSPDVGLLVGKRGPGGDADYVQVQGQGQAQASVYLARGSMSYFLAQDPSYWYERHVLPDDVQGTTIAAITVSGSLRIDETGDGAGGRTLRGGYTLRRPSAEKQDQWVIGSPEKPADRMTAGAMAGSLATLEAVDLVESAGGGEAARAEGLQISVTTFEGRKYAISVRRGPEPGRILITTDWSPWTYVVNALLLERAVLPESVLEGRR
jgi:hypothetical protein